MAQLVRHKEVIKASYIRTPAAGPEPANTLVYLRCPVAGVDVFGTSPEYRAFDIQFNTDFRIDGYLQAQHGWYEVNTQVSATAMFRKLNTTTDLEIQLSVESVEPFLDTDGSIGFVVRQSSAVDDESILFGGGEVVVESSVSAYILCYEPRPELPPSGTQGTKWYREQLVVGERILPKIWKKASRSRKESRPVHGCWESDA